MSTKCVAFSFCLYHAQVLSPHQCGTFACPYPMAMGPMGVAVSGDSIQAKRRFSKIFKGWQKRFELRVDSCVSYDPKTQKGKSQGDRVPGRNTQ
jgi:hypothetical protein